VCVCTLLTGQEQLFLWMKFYVAANDHEKVLQWIII
jgi:hypothetical protein